RISTSRFGAPFAATTRCRSCSTGAAASGVQRVDPRDGASERTSAAPTGARSSRSSASYARAATPWSERRLLTPAPYAPTLGRRARWPTWIFRRDPSVATLQVLAGRRDSFDTPLGTRRLARQRLHRDDPLALLAGDLRPVVGMRRVGQILVLLELFADRRQEIVGPDALLPAADVALERE